ncbi:hypothetical protein FOMG_18967 [Fusarium oxysporum f. sp. melonis 26406]|uniref:Zn(2)-C6 fungal-type domain-containing protein n=2 Tax=Fusarium oxysporum f. sp. melonis 26406 TaxID=1089452 RepID=W9ZT62_FUSOX|nr:hypothetical protein FOMG_18967 [Fusarium oxysporum f. sp. melonis 26406]
MSGRVMKQKLKKSSDPPNTSDEGESLLHFAVLNHYSVDMPCTNCFKNKIDCQFDNAGRFIRCEECIRRDRSCDSVRVASSLNRLIEQQEKLEAKEEEAGDKVLVLHNQLAELQSSLAEAVSRLQRIRKIKKKVKERGANLFERGMQELDKEGNILPALQSHEEWVVKDLQSLGVPNDVEWSSLGLGNDFNDVGSLLDPDVDETSSGVAGH